MAHSFKFVDLTGKNSNNSVIYLSENPEYRFCSCITARHLLGYCPFVSGFGAFATLAYPDCASKISESKINSRFNEKGGKVNDPYIIRKESTNDDDLAGLADLPPSNLCNLLRIALSNGPSKSKKKQ